MCSLINAKSALSSIGNPISVKAIAFVCHKALHASPHLFIFPCHIKTPEKQKQERQSSQAPMHAILMVYISACSRDTY